MKRKPSPQLSSSSTSEEEEDATSEDEAHSKEDVKQQPKQVQEEEESESEEESSDEEKGEEEDDEEEEEEEEEEEDAEDDNEKVIDLSSPRSSQFKIAVRETPAEKPKSPPPPAKQKHAAVKPPAKPVESKPLPTDTKKSKPAPSSSPQKRAVNVKEVRDKEANGSKKRKVAGDSKPDQNSPAVVVASSVENDQKRRRVWDDENEIRLLRTYLEHLRKGVNDNEIYDDVLKVLGGSFNKRQLREKMRSFKMKHEAVKEKAKGKPVFKTAHEEELYKFGEKIWGDKEDSELKEHENLRERTSNEKTSANSIGRGNIGKTNAKINGVERSSSKTKVDDCEPDSKLKTCVANMEIDVNPNHLKDSTTNGDDHVVDGKKDVKGNQNSVLNQAAVKVSAQILENGDLQGDLCEYEMVESGKLYMKTDDLVKEGVSIAMKSDNLEFQQELRELDRMKKELKVLQLEIILRQVKLAQAAIIAQK